MPAPTRIPISAAYDSTVPRSRRRREVTGGVWWCDVIWSMSIRSVPSASADGINHDLIPPTCILNPSADADGTDWSSLHQLIRRQLWIQNFLRRLDTSDRQNGRINLPKLRQHGRLVPIDVLVREFPVAEMDDNDQRNLHVLRGWFNARQHPIHFD